MSAGAARPKKLVLAVIDGLKPSMLERAIAAGRAPALAAIMERGVYIDDSAAAFPSVTPVCAASIATGVGPDQHRIASMNWWHRGERRHVEYGSSFSASRQVGVLKSLTDTVYNMNLVHLAADVPTVFELLDDADVRTAGTTYLMYRGRHRHEVSQETALARLATATMFRHAVYGPRELFYADLFASRRTGCRSQLGLPGMRDQHAGCVGQYLVENDLFDFLLLSLPDNDTWSHKNGPHATVASIATADRQLERMMDAAGGPDAFLDEHAVIVAADHAHTTVERAVPLPAAFPGFDVVRPGAAAHLPADIAVCPAQRSAMLYVLDEDRRERMLPEVVAAARAVEGADLVAWMASGTEAAVAGPSGELRFAPGGDVSDARGETWSLEGDLEVLDAGVQDGRVGTPAYPDALARLWQALRCPTSGDVLLSAGPGWEFADIGGAAHVGGGSHGSLHRSDSLGVLLFCGAGPGSREEREQWTLRDILPAIAAHFGVPAGRA